MARSKVKRQDQDPAKCDTSDHNRQWMLNDHGRDPCEVVEQVLHVCSPEPDKLGTVPSNMVCPGDPTSSCCCNVATYALMSACWVCQGGHRSKDFPQVQPTYDVFLDQCSDKNAVDSYPDVIKPQMDILHIPSWASARPDELDEHWDYHKAGGDMSSASGHSPNDPSQIADPQIAISSFTSLPSTPTSELSQTTIPSGVPVNSVSSKSSTPPGTIAASVLGAIALACLLGVAGWLCWRWRRRRMARPSPGAKVDLTEPEMQEGFHASGTRRIDLISDTQEPVQRASPFPFPYESVIPRYHPNVQHSYEPSRSDDLTEPAIAAAPPRGSGSDVRRHTAPTPLSPVDQLDRDLANLTGEPQGQVHHPYIHKTPMRRRASMTTFTGSSGSASSRRARRKSGADVTEGAKQGRYFHLPPSAQYLADVARYPETVDPERPWNVRRA